MGAHLPMVIDELVLFHSLDLVLLFVLKDHVEDVVHHFIDELRWVATLDRWLGKARANCLFDVLAFEVATVGDVVDSEAWVQIDAKLLLHSGVLIKELVERVHITRSDERIVVARLDDGRVDAERSHLIVCAVELCYFFFVEVKSAV